MKSDELTTASTANTTFSTGSAPAPLMVVELPLAVAAPAEQL